MSEISVTSSQPVSSPADPVSALKINDLYNFSIQARNYKAMKTLTPEQSESINQRQQELTAQAQGDAFVLVQPLSRTRTYPRPSSGGSKSRRRKSNKNKRTRRKSAKKHHHRRK